MQFKNLFKSFIAYSKVTIPIGAINHSYLNNLAGHLDGVACQIGT